MLSLRTVSALCRQNKYVLSGNIPRALFCSKVSGAEKDASDFKMNHRDQMMYLSPYNRVYMLFARKHKSYSDVPEYMTIGEFQGLINRARIGMNVFLTLLMLSFFCVALYKGKSQSKAGDTLGSRNRELAKRLDAEKAEAAAAKKE